jgi:hypothetical protein
MAEQIIKRFKYYLSCEYSDNIVDECSSQNNRLIKFRGFNVSYESFPDDIMAADIKQLKRINDVTSDKFINGIKIIITEDTGEQLHWNACVAVKSGLFLTSPLSCTVYNFGTLYNGVPTASFIEEEVKAAAINNLIKYASFDTLAIRPNELNYLISAGISSDSVSKVIIEMDYDSVKHIPDIPFPNIACVGIRRANYYVGDKILTLFLNNERNINVSNYTARPFLDYYGVFSYDKNKYIGVPKILDNNDCHYMFEVALADFIAYKPEPLTLIKNACKQ